MFISLTNQAKDSEIIVKVIIELLEVKFKNQCQTQVSKIPFMIGSLSTFAYKNHHDIGNVQLFSLI